MEPAIVYLDAMAIAAIALPAILMLIVPSKRKSLGFVFWLLSPFIVYAAIIVYETAGPAGSTLKLNDAFLGLSLLSAMLLLPWLFLSAIGALIGYLARWFFSKL